METQILGIPFKQLDKFLDDHGKSVRNVLMQHIAIRGVDILKKRFSMFEREIRFGKILTEGQINILSPELQAMVPRDDYFIFGDVVWYQPTEDKYGPEAGPAIVTGCHKIIENDNRLRDLGLGMYTVRRLSMTDVIETHENGWLHNDVLYTDKDVVVPLRNMEHVSAQVWALRIQHYSDSPSRNAELAVVIASILRMMFLMEYASLHIDNFKVNKNQVEVEQDAVDIL